MLGIRAQQTFLCPAHRLAATPLTHGVEVSRSGCGWRQRRIGQTSAFGGLLCKSGKAGWVDSCQDALSAAT
ncbi:hypothetical protein [Muricoccus nepalensis]|uniref:hypothetical protein n=1 Tax=Muricoccus nepalensis TaxID=1854500 RepID=UPI0011285F7B|nr:hypothetical protein [Roseomonas nepalensis]